MTRNFFPGNAPTTPAAANSQRVSGRSSLSRTALYWKINLFHPHKDELLSQSLMRKALEVSRVGGKMQH